MGTFKLFTLLIHFYMCVVNVSSIYITENAYKGIYISISESVEQDDFKIQKLKDVLTKSSEFIYHATRKRSYFGEFIILYPNLWTPLVCGKEPPPTEVFRQVDIHLTNSDLEPQLTTKHSRGCGLKGDRIDMPLKWLNQNIERESLAQQFVQQWSIYRYGVFEEKPMIKDFCYLSGKSWTPVGCYNIKDNYSEPTFENGLPMCSLRSNFTDIKELTSSLMSEVNSAKVLDFCDGSPSFPHNPAMPTLHNALCKGRTVWSVIENSLDFTHGMNPVVQSVQPPKNPVFKCYRKEPIHVTFAIQTNTVANLEPEHMSQIGSTLYQFLWNMVPRDSKITGVTFSDEEDSQERFDLQISDENKLYDTLQRRVKAIRPINNVCLSCGLQKALNVTRETSSPAVVVVIAWKSALVGENPAELAESIKAYPPNVRLHLILVEDTEVEDIPIDIIQPIRSLGGFIYSLPKERIFRASKLLTILAAVVKSPTQVEDSTVVVHERIYRNITKNFVDSFIIPSGEISKMLYIMYCSPTYDSIIYSNNRNCSSPTLNSDTTFKCSEVRDFNNKKVSNKWEYPFTYLGTSGPLHCSSVAMLQSSPSPKPSFTLKGWLSDYLVKVPQNVPIIYVEITGLSGHKFEVQAQISCPGLKSPVLLELRDNGNGDPDTKAGDGIYSRYFTKFTEKGLYTVTVSAERLTTYASSYFVGESLKQVQNKTIGFFYVSDPVPKLDILPPNQVADLRVVSINHDNKTAELQWTAPGGDYDSGEATAYEIKYSQHPSSLSALYFNEVENFLLPPAQGNQPINPNTNGKKELITFQFPKKTHNSAVYYVSLRAIDENNNVGDISNIIQVYFNQYGKEMTVKPTSSTDATNLTSSDPTSPDMMNITNDITDETSQTISVSEISSTLPNNATISPTPSNVEEFFDKKTIIILSSSGGILLLLIIINIIICCCCIKKMKRSPNPRKLSRKDSLRPPYNINIAYQEGDPHSSSNTDNFIGASMSTLADPNDYAEPEARTKPSRRKYSYHTEKSLQSKTKKRFRIGLQVSPNSTRIRNIIFIPIWC